MINKYKKHVLTTLRPSNKWQLIRLVMHLMALPFKVAFNAILGSYAILSNSTLNKTRTIPAPVDLEQRKKHFTRVLSMLPMIQAPGYKMYAPKVPFGASPDGSNHDSTNQLVRQSILQFLCGHLNASDDMITMGTSSLMYENYLARGMKVNPYEQTVMINFQSASIDTLSGLNLAMVTQQIQTYETHLDGTKYVNVSKGDDILREKYERLVVGIVETNDFSLLEGAFPSDKLAQTLYNEQLKKVNNQPEYIKMKSYLGMMQPGLELTSDGALALLAAVRIAEKKLKKREWSSLYSTLIWKYGYGLLGLFSSSSSDSNHLSNMMNLYVLSKLSDSPAGRFFWKMAMKFTWALTKNRYNGFYTGLLEKAHPGTVSEEYIDICQRFLCEEEPRLYSYGNTVTSKSKSLPVKFNEQNDLDFSPECQLQLEVHHDIESERIRSGLGFLAHLIMLEKNPEVFLK